MLKIFLKNNSLKSVDNGHKALTTEEFRNLVENILRKNEFEATVVPAARFDVSREDERYGVFVIVDTQWEISQVTNLLYAAAFQGTMHVAANGEALPAEFKLGKQCVATADTEGAKHLMYRIHNAMKADPAAAKNFELVVYENDGKNYLWSVSRPGESSDAWQKYIGAFLRKQGLKPVFSTLQTAVISGNAQKKKLSR